MKRPHPSEETSSSPEAFVEKLIEATKLSRSSGMIRQAPRYPRISNDPSTVELWGEDASADFIETNWKNVEKTLLDFAESRQALGRLGTPKLGLRAQRGILEFASKKLPGVEVEVDQNSLSVSWESLCR